MRKEGRYKTSHLLEDQYEPGSQQRVLKNLLGIKRKREIDRLELQEQFKAIEKLTIVYGQQHKFSALDVCNIHKIWLGNIYGWAGQYRSVNISKGNFEFAKCLHIPQLMEDYEKKVLSQYTPCIYSSNQDIAEALAIVHVELLLIHPFREGNGRLARLLANLMVFQAGLPVLDFGGLQGKKKKEYIGAIQVGLDRNYDLMTKIFLNLIKKSLRKFS